jgi:hypothetical protein
MVWELEGPGPIFSRSKREVVIAGMSLMLLLIVKMSQQYQRCPVLFLHFVPLLSFKEGSGVVTFDFINLKDKKSQKPKPDHPQPLLNYRRGAKNIRLHDLQFSFSLYTVFSSESKT